MTEQNRTEQNRTEHLPALDFIKILATFAIVFCHYQQFLGVRFSYCDFVMGHFPVFSVNYLFFEISGFLMASHIESIRTNEMGFSVFMGKRVFRLLPLTALSAIIYEMVVGIFHYFTGSSWQKVTTEMGIKGVVGIDGFAMLTTMTGTSAGWFYKGPMVNGVTWYISVLILCYIVFYCGCRITAYYSVSSNYAFAIMIIVGLSCWGYRVNLPFLNDWSMRGYIPFFIGGELSS